MNQHQEISKFSLGAVLDLLADTIDDINKLKSTFSEPEFIDDLLSELVSSKTTIEFLIGIHGEKTITEKCFAKDDNHADTIHGPRIKAAEVFLRNPEVSIHTLKQNIAKCTSAVKISPFIDAYVTAYEGKKSACDNDTNGDGDCHLCHHLPDGCPRKSN